MGFNFFKSNINAESNISRYCWKEYSECFVVFKGCEKVTMANEELSCNEGGERLHLALQRLKLNSSNEFVSVCYFLWCRPYF